MFILSFLTMSFFGIFAIKPTLQTITQLRREITDSQLVNDALEQKIITQSQLKEEFKKIEKDLPLISKALPSEPSFSFFLQDLEDLAQETETTVSGVKINSVDLTKKETKSSISVSSSFALSGDYSACKNFLERLLNNSRLYTVDRFEIRSNPTGIKTIKLDLGIDAYYFLALSG
ncbi:type 4a pilus biogenesis protein PilO [Candidatus Microgenomates bacterium]|nr:type 4a pilus biogenesis protein PilO [Candidatus Microgenomates bacterium]